MKAEKSTFQVVRLAGINWAREDLILSEDVTLASGAVMKKGKKYFTWYEAVALEREDKLPKGFRLPAVDELRVLCGKAIFKDIAEVLSLKCNGWIRPLCMDRYNEAPEARESFVESGDFGICWSSTKCGDSLFAYDLAFDTNGSIVFCGNKNFGYSIRCVADYLLP